MSSNFFYILFQAKDRQEACEPGEDQIVSRYKCVETSGKSFFGGWGVESENKGYVASFFDDGIYDDIYLFVQVNFKKFIDNSRKPFAPRLAGRIFFILS